MYSKAGRHQNKRDNGNLILKKIKTEKTPANNLGNGGIV